MAAGFVVLIGAPMAPLFLSVAAKANRGSEEEPAA